MSIFKSKLGSYEDLRKITERRTLEQKWRHDRRVQPDRRLNNILVERIPFSKANLNPARRKVSCFANNNNQAKGTPRNEQSLVCTFKNKSGPNVDLRKVAERRSQQQLRPFNRRVHPDRRLNNISVEWITYS
jgi:hypothetical protein